MRNDDLMRVRIAEGELRGHWEQETFAFKGIPYAAPPTGNLRWRPPQPIAPWSGVRDACHFGAASWQVRASCVEVGGGDPGVTDEDCLYLNVWSPDLSPKAKMPVMVWVHGGGFNIGSGGLSPYNGAALARRGVVVVTLNYRLGHLGFFAHPALDAEYAEGSEINNFALLDLIAALQWVQRNIAAFGGDQNNVTLFGESSGARSVLSLFASPLTEGLFHKGIAQSAYALPDTPRQKALLQGTAVANAFDLQDATAEQLRALPADAFMTLPPPLAVSPVPIVGDLLLPEPMMEVFAEGKQRKLPLMIGSNSDEASVLSYFGVDVKHIVQQLMRKQPVGMRLMKAFYRDAADVETLGRQLTRDMVFTTLGYMILKGQAKADMPGWRYYFDYVSENARDLYPHGTWHGNEIAYVLDTLDALPVLNEGREYTAGDRKMAEHVCDYWVTFARDATPFTHSLQGVKRWPAWRPGKDRTLCIGEGGQAEWQIKKNFMKWRMRLFSRLIHRLVTLE
ncbi:carboxylesterase [Enterobacterales bacterium CwR94]|nr:carboxylesterase [Enterobacterales bacterium CwR94]